MKPDASVSFVVCIQNKDYPASLEVRKIYQRLPDTDAAQHRLLRIMDESGEDYLYPEAYFITVELPEDVQEILLKAA